MTLGCKKTCRSQGMAVKGHFISFRARPGRFFAARIDNSGETVVSYFYPECHTGVLMQIQTKKFAGLTGNQLKLLALLAMTCDHVGLQLLPRFIILRIIGRLAAPLFAYMIAEGCRYTHDRGRYLGRLLGMAALCQSAYFVAMRSLYQCIFVTFSLSVCLIYALDNALRRRKPASVLIAAAAIAAVVFITVGLPRILIHTDFDVDYGLWGVMLPVLVYFGRGKWEKLTLFAVGVGLLGLHYGGTQWWGLLSVPLLALYNGKKGTWNIGPLFYWYYPAHLVVIYGLSLLLERAAG